MHEGVGHEEITVFIVDAWNGERELRQKSESYDDDGNEENDDRKSFVRGEAGKK
jgi:hypothetical protein